MSSTTTTTTTTTFSYVEKLRAVRREIMRRKKVYPNRVQTGRMSDKEAAFGIAIMEAIAADLELDVNAGRGCLV